MKNFIHKIIAIATTIVVFSSQVSCLKEDIKTSDGTVNSFKDITVPGSFKFATTRNVDMHLSLISSDKTSNYSYVARIYDKAPDKGGHILVSGAFDNTSYSYGQVLNLATYQAEVYLEVYLGNEPQYATAISVTNNSISVVIPLGAAANKSVKTWSSYYVLTGYTDISGSNSYSPNPGDKLRIPAGSTFTGGINCNANGGTLYLAIEGTANFQYLNVNNGKLEVIIGDNGSSNSFQDVKKDVILTNYSNVINARTISGKIINYATANISSELNINSGGTLENYSSINIAGSVNVNSQSYFLNQGHANIVGNFTINSNGRVDNSCSLNISGAFMDNGKYNMAENSYIYVTGESRFNSNSTAVLANDSYFKTNAIWNDSQLTGPQSGYAIVQYTTSKGGNSKTYYTNNIYLIDKDGKDENSNTVSFKIAKSECSPGFGKDNDINDSDGDGIANELDDFPDDSERAFLNTIGSGTLLFEDLWPNLGDYDFNDLVAEYQYYNILNAKNKIIGVQANFKVLAIGASLDNGFGFSLPVTNSQIKSVTGYSRSNSNTDLNLNGTEAGHSDGSVIIVYDNLSSVGEMMNVYKGSNSKSTDEIKIDIAFTGDVDFSKSQINPFIYLNQDRGKEVHLAGYAPTNEGSRSYFGFADDNSGSTYYTSNEGLPWALDVPTSISYMQEGYDFIKGYPDFVNWVETGGAENKNWYLTNINQEVLY